MAEKSSTQLARTTHCPSGHTHDWVHGTAAQRNTRKTHTWKIFHPAIPI
ncbi:hypothetical protein [Corynebacterium mustelae]|nr:hypothetical protein [Corynebacterium mustelae]